LSTARTPPPFPSTPLFRSSSSTPPMLSFCPRWLLMLSLCTPVQAIAKEAERGPRHPAACVPGATVRRLGPPPTHPHLQVARVSRSEEHTSELQSRENLV